MFDSLKTTVAFWVEGHEEIHSVMKLLDKNSKVTYWYSVKSHDTVRFEMKGFRRAVETALSEVTEVFSPKESWVDLEESLV